MAAIHVSSLGEPVTTKRHREASLMPRMLWLAHSVPRPLPWLLTPDCSFSGEGCDQKLSQPEGERAFNVALLAVGGFTPLKGPAPDKGARRRT